MTAMVPAAGTETPIFFTAGSESIFGIFTDIGVAHAPAVAILSGGLTGTSTVGRNQMFVRLARQLATAGFHSMRLDYHGMGESTGTIEEFRLDAERPFVADILAAVDWMRAEGVSRFVLVGKCFGSRMALYSTASIDPLAGLVLIGPPVRDFGKGEKSVTRMATELSLWGFVRRAIRPHSLRGWLDPRSRRAYALAARAKLGALETRLLRRPATNAKPDPAYWVSPKFLELFEALVRRGVPIQIIYGRDDEFYQDFVKASQGRLGQLLDRAGPLVELTLLDGQVRGFAQGPVQEGIIEATQAWIGRLGITAAEFGTPGLRLTSAPLD